MTWYYIWKKTEKYMLYSNFIALNKEATELLQQGSLFHNALHG